MKKKISVIIPTYNRKNVVMDALKSVLNQKKHFWDYEIIVSDDGSSDGTKKLFKKINNPAIIYLYSKKNKGVNAARNLGIKHSSGNYLLFLDSDDVLVNECFQTFENYFKRKKLATINFFSTAEKNSGKIMTFVKKEKIFSYKEWLAQKEAHGEFLSFAERKVFKNNNLFDENFFCFEVDFWTHNIKKYGVFISKKVLRLYSYEQENRVSKKLMEIKNAKKRYKDYRKYLKNFGKDYEMFGLKKKYANILFMVGFYATMINKTKIARRYFKKSLKTSFNTKSLFGLILSLFKFDFIIFIYKLVMKFTKI